MEVKFPDRIQPDETTRAGRMMAAGDVRITVQFLDGDDDEHITVRFKAYLDNRTSGGRPRAIPESDRNWVRVPLNSATHVFIEVPTADGEWSDKIGTFYPKNGKLYQDSNADPQRVYAAEMAVRWINMGRDVPDDNTIGSLAFQEEARCGKCGRTLTDPVSIERGIGPECFGQATGSAHQKKGRQLTIEEMSGLEAHSPGADNLDHLTSGKSPQVQGVLTILATMTDEDQRIVYDELEMWHSQGRKSVFGGGR